jgi:hypothetical protein
MPGPSTFSKQILEREEIPLTICVVSFDLLVMVVPGKSGLKVFLTRIGIFPAPPLPANQKTPHILLKEFLLFLIFVC